MIVELLSCRARARWCAEVLEVRLRAVEALGAVPAHAVAIRIKTTVGIRLRAVRAIFTELLPRTEAGGARSDRVHLWWQASRAR